MVSRQFIAMIVAEFTAAMARGLDIHCGCFSAGGGHGVSLGLIARDVLLLAGCVLLLLARRR